MKTLLALSVVLALLPQEAPKEDPRFARLKKLVGVWAAEAEPGKVASSWRLTAGGSALLETFFPGSPQEMVTLYTMDGKNLKLTHYCMMGNQPSMTAAKEIKDGVLAFECSGVGNTASHNDPHMHSARLVFTSDDAYTADWGLSKDGKDGDRHVFKMKRK